MEYFDVRVSSVSRRQTTAYAWLRRKLRCLLILFATRRAGSSNQTIQRLLPRTRTKGREWILRRGSEIEKGLQPLEGASHGSRIGRSSDDELDG